MNRWLTRKKDGVDEPATGKKAKKAKKGQPEPKPEFNLDAALPKDDDFRTSLIMPGLSTRFSMLRDQDDPNSKMGKASDDSVLPPKTQPRLHDLGFVPGGLSDIAEVASLNGSLRRPFATNDRSNSFDSRDEDDGGSVMSRPRPGEGNILFGGRQKIYMVSSNSTKGLGRTLYDDDVNMSAFQKLRHEEKERLRQQEAEDHHGDRSEPSSPSATSRKRETSSSTNSATLNMRTSTAATSIASQGANSVAVSSPTYANFNGPLSPDPLSPDLFRKPRRLYDQGLDLHIQEQQSSAINRLNSIQRARGPNTGRATPPLPFARSASNLSERFNKGPAFRSESPNFFKQQPGMSRNNSSAGASPVLSRPQSPVLPSPIVSSDGEEALALHTALQPHDRGKATAMGAFNKPKQAFSEQQYAERLRHLHRDRDILPQAPAPKGEPSHSRKPTLRERAEQEKRRRAGSVASQQQRPDSPPEPAPAPSAFSKFQAAASQMRVTGPATPNAASSEAQDMTGGAEPVCDKATFLNSRDSSGSSEEETAERTTVRQLESMRRLPTATWPAPDIFEHPAMRSRSPSRGAPEQSMEQQQPSPIRDARSADALPSIVGADIDSPTSSAPDNAGLSGLIRQHLRNASNVSSNYGESDYGMTGPPATAPVRLALRTQDIGLQPRQATSSENVTPAPSTYSHSNPWDLDDIDNQYRDEARSYHSISPVDNFKVKVQDASPDTTDPSVQWDLTPRRNHERVASNETEADHEAFQRDLAQRQRVIQENLRARAEGRSTSPAPSTGGGLKTALNMLRAKSSRESFATVDRHPDLPTRLPPRKMPAGNSSRSASSTSLAGLSANDPPRPEMPALRSKASRMLQEMGQDIQREHENRQRSGADGGRTGRPLGRSPPPTSGPSSNRERSGSGTSGGPSQSRPGEYRDDVDQAMTEGSQGAYPPNMVPSMPGYAAERPSIDSQGRMRSRSNSKTGAANHFESKHLQPIQTGPASANVSPRLGLPKYSPGIPISPRPSPGGYNSALPSPIAIPPYAANQTTPVSSPTSPNPATYNPNTVQLRQAMLRKKSVAKSEISEPVLLSMTSQIDTVNLPAGASLNNGLGYDAPPVPPINPMRKRFNFGQADAAGSHNPYDPAIQPGLDSPRAPYAEQQMRTKSSDALPGGAQQPRNRLRKNSSEGRSLRGQAQAQSGPSPGLPPPGGAFAGRNDSPPRPMNDMAATHRAMDGAMF
ncbi:hypothetical protein ACEQ8H_007047 [Pleosporales sp. CAS-2024a]